MVNKTPSCCPLHQYFSVGGNAMKSLITTIIVMIFLVGCNEGNNKNQRNYIESHPSFFSLRHNDWLSNPWLRQPENLLMLNETLKKVGYHNIISELLSSNPVICQDIYINKLGFDLIDSLVLSYNKRDNSSNYCKEFWARRKAEKNDSVVFLILNDLKYSYKTKMTSGVLQLDADDLQVNDTLRHLLEIEYRSDVLSNELAVSDFTYLKSAGFHQSAYNLLFERYQCQDMNWNRDSLAKTLKHSATPTRAWFEDDTK
jgi:hypothetical protein